MVEKRYLILDLKKKNETKNGAFKTKRALGKSDRRVLEPSPGKVEGLLPRGRVKARRAELHRFGGGKRPFTVRGYMLWTDLCGVQLSAQFTAAMCL
jgi:hypothetical protein